MDYMSIIHLGGIKVNRELIIKKTERAQTRRRIIPVGMDKVETKLTDRTASLEQQVFGDVDRRTLGLSKLDSPESILYTLLAVGLITIPLINILLVIMTLLISDTQADSLNTAARPEPGLVIASFAVAVIAPVIAIVAIFNSAGRHLRVMRERLRGSDMITRLLNGWRVEYGDGPLASWLRSIELVALKRRILLNEFAEAFRQLDYSLGLRSRPWPPMLVNGLLIWLLAAMAIITPILSFPLSGEVMSPTAGFILMVLLLSVQALIIPLVALPVVRQLVQQSLLREHLREIDNGVLTAAATPGIRETADA